MDHAELAARDPRVRAILTDPDAYFSAALRLAWPQAGADVQAVLDRHAQARREDAGGLRVLRLLPRSILPSRRPRERFPSPGQHVFQRRPTCRRRAMGERRGR
jgi:hypothetical protein